MAPPAVLPSVTCHDVGTLVAIISQLNTLPACAPVNASMAALRLATHDSGSGWLAIPFLCDSFIHYSTPVYPGALAACEQLTPTVPSQNDPARAYRNPRKRQVPRAMSYRESMAPAPNIQNDYAFNLV